MATTTSGPAGRHRLSPDDAPPAAASGPRDPAPAPGLAAQLLRRLGTGVVVILLAQLPVRIWVAEPLSVGTSSMTPSLTPGERVLTWKLGAGHHTWQRGDVVSFHHEGQVWVKRVVGTAGDVVGIEDGHLVVNGTRVREPWSDPALIDSVFFGPVTVPTGTVFVLGDDRSNSRDSRDYGPVPVRMVTGRVTAVVWPLSELGGIAR